MSVSSPIPADPALEEDLVIHECQAGYSAQGAKFAVISCAPPAAHGNFEIQESDSQLTRFAGTLIYAGWQWGRHCWLADAWFLAVEYICALGSSVLKDPALRLIAERQVQFVLGANPFTWVNTTAWFLAVLALLAHDDFETLKVQR